MAQTAQGTFVVVPSAVQSKRTRPPRGDGVKRGDSRAAGRERVGVRSHAH